MNRAIATLLYLFILIFTSNSITVIPVFDLPLYSSIQSGFSSIRLKDKIATISGGTELELLDEYPTENPLYKDMLYVNVLHGLHEGKKGYIEEDFIYPKESKETIYFYLKNDYKKNDILLQAGTKLKYTYCSCTTNAFALSLEDEIANMLITGDLTLIRYKLPPTAENRYRLNSEQKIIRIFDAATLLGIENAKLENLSSDLHGYIYLNSDKIEATIQADGYITVTKKLDRKINVFYLEPTKKFQKNKISSSEINQNIVITNKSMNYSECILIDKQSMIYKVNNEPTEIPKGIYELYFETIESHITANRITASIYKSSDIAEIVKSSTGYKTTDYNLWTNDDKIEGEYPITHKKKSDNEIPVECEEEMTISVYKYSMKIRTVDKEYVFLLTKSNDKIKAVLLNRYPNSLFNPEIYLICSIYQSLDNLICVFHKSDIVNSSQLPDFVKKLPIQFYGEEISQ